MHHYLLVNFGGPRNLDEVSPFLKTLLRDRDVTGTALPKPLHYLFFGWIARRRALKVREDYELIGGKSPIYSDTENLADALSQKLDAPVLTFHRYLPATHRESLANIEKAPNLTVLPLFPQFCYATTGSIARFFSKKLSKTAHLSWIRSYPAHPAFIAAFKKRIADFLAEKKLDPSETVLLFSAHGVPQSFIEGGDIYQSECELSFAALKKEFPEALSKLAYQSKFGRGEWLKPYTQDACETILTWSEGRKHIVFIPLSFTSDHVETLFEIQYQYLPLIEAKGLNAYRCPALNLETYWVEAIAEIVQEPNRCPTNQLIRP